MKQPYKFWTKTDLHLHLKHQAHVYKFEDLDYIKKAVYSRRWNPIYEYNGCNVVQDELHPFLPCFLHDYEWVVNNGGNKVDLEFRNNLRIFGFSKMKSNLYYFMVRLGWIFYYKWVKNLKTNYKKN